MARKLDAGNPRVRFDEPRRGNAAMTRAEAPAEADGNGCSPCVCGRARHPPTPLRPLPGARIAGRIRRRGKRLQADHREPVQAGGCRWSKADAIALLAAECCIENNRWADFLGRRAVVQQPLDQRNWDAPCYPKAVAHEYRLSKIALRNQRLQLHQIQSNKYPNMRYAAIICPRRGLSAKADNFLTNLPETGTNWQAAEAPTTRRASELVKIRPQKDGSPAELITTSDKLDRFFSASETRLWIPRSISAGHTEVALERPNLARRTVNSQFRVFERVSAKHVDMPPELLNPLSKGTLFRALPPGQNLKHGTFCIQVRVKSRQDDLEEWAMLNPWVFLFDTNRPLNAEDLVWFNEVMKGSEVDFHLDFPPAEWLRLRLHLHLRRLWGRNVVSPLPRLIFGGNGEEWENARAFLVLDSMGDSFIVRGRTNSCPDSSEIYWEPSERTEKSGAIKHWPVAEAQRVIGRPTEQNEEYPALSVSMPTSETGVISRNMTLSQLFQRIFKKNCGWYFPPELETLAEGLSALSDTEISAIESLNFPAGSYSGALISKFVRNHLIPRSTVQVDWPCPPKWLEESAPDAFTLWEQTNAFDPTKARRGEIPEWVLTAWWLRLILPGNEEVSPLWRVQSDLWKVRFFATLFRRGEPSRWADPHPGGQLGSGRLGEFPIGRGSQREKIVSGPWDAGRWPHVLDFQ